MIGFNLLLVAAVGVLAATGPTAASTATTDGTRAVFGAVAPPCITYYRGPGGAISQAVNVVNQCRTAHEVRVDTVEEADSSCVFVPPWEERSVEIPYYMMTGEVQIRGIVLC